MDHSSRRNARSAPRRNRSITGSSAIGDARRAACGTRGRSRVEQLLGNLREDLVDGLNWTPLETFRKRATFCRQSDGPSPRLRNACGRPCVDVAEARSAARSRRGTPPAGGHSAQVARSHNAVECPEWPPLDSSCHGMAANIRSRRWTHLVRST